MENKIIDGRFKIRYVEETGSTNLDLAEAVKRGEETPPAQFDGMESDGMESDGMESADMKSENMDLLGSVLVADHQTAGKGRLGRQWVSKPGEGLLVSILVWPSSHLNLYLVNTCLSMAAVAACTEMIQAGKSSVEPPFGESLSVENPSVEHAANTPPQKIETKIEIKWPNDLVVNDLKTGMRKLGGMLSELISPNSSRIDGSLTDGVHTRALVMGIGINLATPNLNSPNLVTPNLASPVLEDGLSAPFSPPPPLPPVGLNDLAKAPVSREELLGRILDGFATRYQKLHTVNTDQLYEEMLGCSALLGKRVKLSVGTQQIEGKTIEGQTIEGQVSDITKEGHLLLKTPNEVLTITAGDVSSIRPGYE